MLDDNRNKKKSEINLGYPHTAVKGSYVGGGISDNSPSDIRGMNYDCKSINSINFYKLVGDQDNHATSVFGDN